MTPNEIADWLDEFSDNAADDGWMDTFGKLIQAAATIRELEAKLKIATEALEDIKAKAASNGRINLCVTSEMITDDAAQALARIDVVEKSGGR